MDYTDANGRVWCLERNVGSHVGWTAFRPENSRITLYAYSFDDITEKIEEDAAT